MSLGRLRFARGRGDAVLAANEENKESTITELDENVLRLWGDMHTSDVPAGRGSVDSTQEAEVPRVAV